MRAGELWVLKNISIDWLISRIWRKNKRAGELSSEEYLNGLIDWLVDSGGKIREQEKFNYWRISQWIDWLIDFRIWRKNLRTEEVWLLKSISITRPTELNLEIINSHRFHLNYATRNQKKLLQRQLTRQIFLLITRPIEQKQHILGLNMLSEIITIPKSSCFFSCFFLWKFKEQATG